MFLSKLEVNAKCRQVRAELASPYEMHRTISKAFGDDGPEYRAARCLFRVDETTDPATFNVLVQSTVQPDWSMLTVSDGYLKSEPQVREFSPGIRQGQRLHFRLAANPTVKKNGRRYGLESEEDQVKWLLRKSESAGFRVLRLSQKKGRKVDLRVPGQDQAYLWSVVFDGLLEVTDPEAFVSSMESGIGSGKGFGFGMLSVAPAK